MERFISEASFWEPETLVTSAWAEHAPFAFWLMDVHRPQSLVELGTHSGYSFLAFNQALKRLRTKSRLFAVDTWQGDEHSGFYGPKVFEELQNYNGLHYGDFSELVQATFDDALARFEDGSIDLLHIDGRHFYDDVKHDFDSWRPKLSKRGVVLMHDTNVRVRDFGVYRLWNEVTRLYPYFEFIHGHGLGVLGVGSELPELLHALFAASRDEDLAQRIQQAYARLGGDLQRRMLSEFAVSPAEVPEDPKLAPLGMERDRLQRNLSDSQDDNRQLDNRLHKLQHDHNALTYTHVLAAQKGADAELLYLKSQEENGRIKANLGQAQQSAQDLARRCEHLSAELKKSHNLTLQSSSEAQRLKAELARETAQLNQLVSSVTWRAGAPLRWTLRGTRSAKHKLASLVRLSKWAATFQLRSRLRLRAEQRILLESGIFDAAVYLKDCADATRVKVNPVEHYLRGGWLECNPSAVFDGKWYLSRNADVSRSGVNPLLHYLQAGWKEGRAPGPYFDLLFYLQQNKDVAGEGAEPLSHYLRAGGFEGRDPNLFFDSDWYLSQYSDVAASGQNPLAHYVLSGWKEGRSPHPLFDTRFYLAKNPDVAQAGIEPLEHYLSLGMLEGRDPNPLFDSKWYLAQYPDVAASGQNPLLHYASYGFKEGRNPHPLFDSKFYLTHSPDVAQADINPLSHYLWFGAFEGRDPSLFFQSKWYLAENPDLDQTSVNPLLHYLQDGWKQGRDPGPHFSSDLYLSEYPDVAGTGLNPLMHYVCSGFREGRQARPAERRASSNAGWSGVKPRIVFVSGEEHTPGHQYRVANIASSLAPRFFDVTVIKSADLAQRLEEIDGAAVVWIWRARWSVETAALLNRARHSGSKVVFDVDDLMFRPELASTDLIDGIRSQNIPVKDVQTFYTDIRQLLTRADMCTVPTVFLANEAKRLHKPVTVIPNGFNRATLERSRAALRARRSIVDDGVTRIGYAAGTKTHQHDFAIASAAIAAILAAHTSCRLVLFRGTIDLAEFPELDKVESQIEWRDQVSLECLPYEYARFDINIAPLEVGNPYCEAKSELKFFEAALAGAPTVASPTHPFAAAIRHAENGFLANSEGDWFDCLNVLILDSQQCRRVADQAYREVLWLYGPERRSQLVTRFVNRILSMPSISSELFLLEIYPEKAAPFPQVPISEYDVLFQSERTGNSRVSVVVPLFNYGHLLPEALESVRQQTIRSIDLIVVDDRSTDNSVVVAREWLSKYAKDFNMVALLQNHQNSKLGKSRNLGIAFSDTECVLPLDPDNLLLPRCIEKSLALLEETGAAFAYPTIEMFGEITGRMGEVEYNPAYFPCGNYIDAMAMVKKSCWLAVGGYSALEPVGWEDYDFWCKLVERGLFGARVTSVIARYRVHNESMLRTITDLPKNRPLVILDLNTRHPWLKLEEVREHTDTPSISKLKDIRHTEASPRVTPVVKELADLLAILRCPETGENLVYKDEHTLLSADTGRLWPLVDGRPVFTPEGRNVNVQSAAHLSNHLPSDALRLIEQTDGLVLNLSAGGTSKRHANVVELEYTIFRNTAVAGDVHKLPFQDEVFSAVVCLNAFEHYRDPEQAMDEVRRVLKPGGRFFMHTAFLQPLHEAPHHYFNCTEFGLRHWLRHFHVECVRVSPNFNPVYALSWLASETEAAFRRDVSIEAATAFGDASFGEAAAFWRNPEARSSALWKSFSDLSPASQHALAAGWEAIARK